MASAKRTTKVLRNPRNQTVAYARKQKPPGDDGTEGDAPDATQDDPTGDADAAPEASAAPAAPEASAAPAAPEAGASPIAAASDATSATPPGTSASAAATGPAPTPPHEAASDPASEAPLRARTETIKMPTMAAIGQPPEMPAEAPAGAQTRAEDPTRMPGPKEIPGGDPDDPAAPPGHVPSGDSRSLRRRTDAHEFALIYRVKTYVITRFGVVGTRGRWRVVEYPTSTAASHAYAKECSRFVSDGFSDYREWSGI